MNVEHAACTPTRSHTREVQIEDETPPPRISYHSTLTSATVSLEPTRRVYTMPEMSRKPVATRSRTPVLPGVHTADRSSQTGHDKHGHLNDGGGDGSDGPHNGLLSPTPASVSSVSRPREPSRTSHAFFHPNSASTTATTTPSVMHFNNTKAGLQSVDKEKTEALINELSKNSSFYMNEERKAQQRQRQIEGLLVKARQYEASVRSRPDVYRQMERDVRNLEASLELHRSFDFIFVHVDMDMFYAAVEMKKNPQYAEVPLGIGSMAMLSTTNYVARRYGVRSGMPGFIGMQLCPQLVIVPTDFAAYRLESSKFKDVVREYDPDALGLGMDEIMMCLNGYIGQYHKDAITLSDRFDVAERITEECRRRITEATGLTASAGIAPTPTLAKMASNYKKPNGQFALRLFNRKAVMNHLAPIPVRQVPGIGKSRESILAGLGIRTLGEVYEQRHRLFYILTRKTYEFLLSSAMGVGGMYDAFDAAPSSSAGATIDKTVATREEETNENDGGRKSVGHERTFQKLKNRMELQTIAHDNLRQSHKTLLAEGLLSSQVVLKVKHRSFHVKQYSKSLNIYTNDHEVLQRALDEILLPVLDGFANFRLLGVRLEKLRRQHQKAGAGGGATTSTTPSMVNWGSPQPTLTNFFARQSVSTADTVLHRPHQRRPMALRNRPVEAGGEDVGSSSEADLDDSDGEHASVHIVSPESHLSDVEEMIKPKSSTALLASSRVRTKASAESLKRAKIEEIVSDSSADDNVVIVE
ncbi:hypothetical protein JKF63_03559 [Porcisia hertigi]|uniref:DNA polymerase kappa n=1 Tax=Porcisia hertigi TaxID=2761500 RepID=A0A836L6A3_9TRYP|nr:hypothetical protein JKF63_03559 [Porcisia hertigi]